MAKKAKEKKSLSISPFKSKGDVQEVAQPKVKREKGRKTETGPVLPKVNLLPPGLVLVVLRARLRRSFALAALVIVTLAGVVYVAQATATSLAKSDLAIASVQRDAAKDTVAKYLPIADYYESLKQRIELAQKAYGESIDYATAFNALRGATPAGVSFTKITAGIGNGREDRRLVAASGGVLNCGPSESPFAASNNISPSGCMRFEGTATSIAAIGQFTEALKSSPTFSEVFIKPTDTGVGITFAGYASIRPELSLEKESYEYALSLGYSLVSEGK